MKKASILFSLLLVLLFTSCMNGALLSSQLNNSLESSNEAKKIVEVMFKPNNGSLATRSELDTVKLALEKRLEGANLSNITITVDYDSYLLTVRFESTSDTSAVNAVIVKLRTTNRLTFKDEKGKIVLDGADVEIARAIKREQDASYSVLLTLNADGATKFAAAAKANIGRTIVISFDDRVLASPEVKSEITSDGILIDMADCSAKSAESLADDINTGKMPIVFQDGDAHITIE